MSVEAGESTPAIFDSRGSGFGRELFAVEPATGKLAAEAAPTMR